MAFDDIAWKAVAAVLREGFAVSSEYATCQVRNFRINGQPRAAYTVMDWRTQGTMSNLTSAVPAYFESAEDAAKAFVDAAE